MDCDWSCWCLRWACCGTWCEGQQRVPEGCDLQHAAEGIFSVRKGFFFLQNLVAKGFQVPYVSTNPQGFIRSTEKKMFHLNTCSVCLPPFSPIPHRHRQLCCCCQNLPEPARAAAAEGSRARSSRVLQPASAAGRKPLNLLQAMLS